MHRLFSCICCRRKKESHGGKAEEKRTSAHKLGRNQFSSFETGSHDQSSSKGIELYLKREEGETSGNQLLTRQSSAVVTGTQHPFFETKETRNPLFNIGFEQYLKREEELTITDVYQLGLSHPSCIVTGCQDSYIGTGSQDSYEETGSQDTYIGTESEDSYIETGSQDTYIGAESQNSYIETGSQDTYIDTESQNSNIETGSQDTYIGTESQNSNIETGSQDTYIETESQNSNIETGSQDTYIGTESHNSYIETGSQDTYIETGNQDSYIETGNQNSYIETESHDSYIETGSQDSYVDTESLAQSSLVESNWYLTRSGEYTSTGANQLGTRQSLSLEEGILSNVRINLMFREYSSLLDNLGYMVNFYFNGRKLRYSIIKQQAYISTSIKRNWANHIEISYTFLQLIVIGKPRNASITPGMIVYLSNNHSMEKTSTATVLGACSGNIKVNIEPDCSYNVRIVYLSITSSKDATKFTVYVHHESKHEIACTHINSHIPIFSVSELRQLERKCRSFTQNHSLPAVMRCIRYFYRNKPPAYFSEIKQNGGDMVPYIKDMTGDPRSPINGRIDGLFFAANIVRGSTNPEHLPPCSPFGSRRLIIPTNKLFNFTNKLYFADFFCMKDHYVTLVMTKPGSQADLYCQSHLLPLNVRDNPYLRLGDNRKVFALHKSQLWVEVMYTETVNINMPEARFTTVRVLGRGKSTPMGISKKTSCPHCNL